MNVDLSFIKKDDRFIIGCVFALFGFLGVSSSILASVVHFLFGVIGVVLLIFGLILVFKNQPDRHFKEKLTSKDFEELGKGCI